MMVDLMDVRLRRLDFSGVLVTLSPIHIGSGEIESLSRNRDGEEEQREIGLFAVDADDAPWIPPTAMKGLLRRLARGGNEAVSARLFGQIKSDAAGAMGALLPRGGRMLKNGHPLGKGERGNAESARSVITRTAVDPGRGISYRNRLFSREVVGVGAEFEFRLRLECRASETDFDGLVRRTLEILANFTKEGNASLGAETKLGLGQVILKGKSVTLVPWATDASGALGKSKEICRSLKTPMKDVARDHRFVLSCDFPFLISDSHHEREKEKNEPHLMPLRMNGKAVVSPSSVLGVLRSRSGWLLELAKIRGKAWQEDILLELFGSEKRKGRLSLRVSESQHGKPDQITSVRIDRFSGAPIEQGLFAIEGETLTFTLDLSLRDASRDAEAFLDVLVQDIKENGLDLGHATTRGFGWFRMRGVSNGLS